MKSPAEQPEITPYCCYKLAKWVVQMPSLAYWYCEVCKKEVPPLDYSPKSPAPVPELPKGYEPGDWVSLPPGWKSQDGASD